ncbi:MAG: hypothetical protein ACFB0D_13340 [Phormidesmis sp.]
MAITLKTDKQGLAVVDQARIKKNWTALAAAWCTQANVSVSTLKRFREKKAIQKDAFIAICRAVGIDSWQQIVSEAPTDISVLRRKYKQSKKVIAEEVLSNLDSLDARIEFVAQAFSDDPSEAQAQMARQKLAYETNQPPTLSYRDRLTQAEDAGIQPVFSRYPLRLEANVSIIQILMEI